MRAPWDGRLLTASGDSALYMIYLPAVTVPILRYLYI